MKWRAVDSEIKIMVATSADALWCSRIVRKVAEDGAWGNQREGTAVMGHMRSHQHKQGEPGRDRGGFASPAFSGHDKWAYLRDATPALQRATSDYHKGDKSNPDYSAEKKQFAEKAGEVVRESRDLVAIVEALLRAGKQKDAYGVVKEYVIGRWGRRHKLLRGTQGMGDAEALKQSGSAKGFFNTMHTGGKAMVGHSAGPPLNKSADKTQGVGDPLILMFLVMAIIKKIQQGKKKW